MVKICWWLINVNVLFLVVDEIESSYVCYCHFNQKLDEILLILLFKT